MFVWRRSSRRSFTSNRHDKVLGRRLVDEAEPSLAAGEVLYRSQPKSQTSNSKPASDFTWSTYGDHKTRSTAKEKTQTPPFILPGRSHDGKTGRFSREAWWEDCPFLPEGMMGRLAVSQKGRKCPCKSLVERHSKSQWYVDPLEQGADLNANTMQ